MTHSFLAFDKAGKFIGYLQEKVKIGVDKDVIVYDYFGNNKFVSGKRIARISRYSLNSIAKIIEQYGTDKLRFPFPEIK